MDWGFIVAIFLTVGFGIATMVLALKLTKQKKPVWAYKTRKIVGLGTDAPPELKLTFSSRPVADVYRTRLIFLNAGNESIRRDDVTDNLTIHFKGAEILRQPVITAMSSETMRFSAKQVVKDGDNSVELGFLFLDHNDGAVIEVLHTQSDEISCSGNIIGSRRVVHIGEFEQTRRRFLRITVCLSLLFTVAFVAIIIISYLASPDSDWRLYLEEHSIIKNLVQIPLSILAGFGTGLLARMIPEYLKTRVFPNWSIIRE